MIPCFVIIISFIEENQKHPTTHCWHARLTYRANCQQLVCGDNA
jgi:hypothetical protein